MDLDALVLFNPVIDNGPGGFGYEKVKSCWRRFSPLHNLSAETPPTVFFLGTKDALVPVETAEAWCDRMREFGLRCDLYLYPEEAHGFFNFDRGENYRRTVEETDRFLVSLGYLKGEPHDRPSGQDV